MNKTPSIRVLIADDHALFREGVVAVLNGEPGIEVVGEAIDGHEVLTQFKALVPDVTLMDLQMPGLSGVEAMRTLRQEFSDARFIILTTYSGDIQVVRALEAGAVGYLLKSSLRHSLSEAIRTVYAGNQVVAPEAAAEVAHHIGTTPLTPKELEVLKRVAMGTSNKSIAAQLQLTESTVKSHMKSVLAKLHANDRTHAVVIASKRGFLDGQ